MTDRNNSAIEAAPGIVFGRWKMCRIDDSNVALYRRRGAKGRGAWMVLPTYHRDAGAALRHAMREDGNDAITVSSDASKLLASWDALMRRVETCSRMLKGRTVPREESRL